jgi:hypothetical protein
MSFSRRDWITASGLGGLGWALASAAKHPARAAQPSAPAARPPIKSCILLFYYGGPSHLETYDPKPDAPAEVRGEYAPIATSVPGTLVSEHLPRTARIVDRLALVRSVHHPMRNHNSAAAEALTGRTPTGGDLELLTDDPRGFPTLGSAVSYALGERAGVLPYVALPYTIYNVVQLPGQTPGMLGSRFDRFQVDGNPNDPAFRVPAFDAAVDLAPRRALWQALDRLAESGDAQRMDTYQRRALELLGSDAVRRAFRVHEESPALRERYGHCLLGQSLLLARRLVEADVSFVTVFDGQTNGQDANWDSHQTIFPRHRQLIPPADSAFSALVEDLAERGLLDSTLVLATGEFGRTPRINGSAGRDHWPDCYTVTLAGGGLRGGALYGASDNIGAYPAVDPVTPGDLAATIYWRFGIDPAQEIHDQTARPFRLAEGKPLAGLFA